LSAELTKTATLILQKAFEQAHTLELGQKQWASCGNNEQAIATTSAAPQESENELISCY